MHKPIIVSVGDIVADLLTVVSFPIETGQLIMTEKPQLEPGGACNFAITAARLGLDVKMVGAPGDDIWGRMILDVLKAENVDTSLVTPIPGADTTLVIVLADKKKMDQTYISAGFHNTGKYPFTDNLKQTIEHAKALYVQGYTLCEDYLWEVTRKAMHFASDAQIPIYLDPSPLWANAAPERQIYALNLVDYIIATEHEIELIRTQGKTTPEIIDSLMLMQGIKAIVVKRGANGCRVASWDDAHTNFWESAKDYPAYPVEAIGASAAGDSFNAGFIASRLRGYSLADSARIANATGAAKVTRMGGGRQVPQLQEIQTILDANKVLLSIRDWTTS